MLMGSRVLYLAFIKHSLHGLAKLFLVNLHIFALHLHVTLLDPIDLLLDLLDSLVKLSASLKVNLLCLLNRSQILLDRVRDLLVMLD